MPPPRLQQQSHQATASLPRHLRLSSLHPGLLLYQQCQQQQQGQRVKVQVQVQVQTAVVAGDLQQPQMQHPLCPQRVRDSTNSPPEPRPAGASQRLKQSSPRARPTLRRGGVHQRQHRKRQLLPAPSERHQCQVQKLVATQQARAGDHTVPSEQRPHACVHSARRQQQRRGQHTETVMMPVMTPVAALQMLAA